MVDLPPLCWAASEFLSLKDSSQCIRRKDEITQLKATVQALCAQVEELRLAIPSNPLIDAEQPMLSFGNASLRPPEHFVGSRVLLKVARMYISLTQEVV